MDEEQADSQSAPAGATGKRAARRPPLDAAAETSYDDLPDDEQAIVRAGWDQQIAEDVTSLNLTAALRASGKPFYTADADGNVITHLSPGADVVSR